MNTRIIGMIFFFLPFLAKGQQEETSGEFSVENCIEYALEHGTSVKNATLDEQSAEAKIKETIGIGLPQVTGTVGVQYSPTLQRFFGEYTGEEGALGPNATEAAQLGITTGDIFASENFFQQKGAGDASLGIQQLIFNGSYIVGVKASKAYKELAVRQKNKTIGDVKVDVSKAYFNVLINQDRLRLFSANVTRLDTLYQNTKELYKHGFAEEIEVDRLKVSLNNLMSEQENLINLNVLSIRLLKFQMNYPLDKELKLSGSVEDILKYPISISDTQVEYENRPDYQVLLAQRKLQELNVQNKYAEVLPTIGAFANLGYSTQSPNFSGIFTTDGNFEEQPSIGPDSWYGYSNFGFNLTWNIFTGLQKNYQIQQEKIALTQLNNSIDQFQNLIEVEVKDAGLTLKNAIKRYEIQKENIEISEKVYRISQLKYEQGVGSNLEVIEADASLKDSQSNYYNALFEMILARIDLNSALGQNQ